MPRYWPSRATRAPGSRGEAVTGIVLAGGQSRRMGADKALLRFQGEKLLERSVRVLHRSLSTVIVVGPERLGLDLEAQVVPDERPHLGPLAGLVTGLRSANSDWAFVTACDMPLLSPDIIDFLLRMPRKGVGAIVPVVDSVAQPLCALYSAGALPALESELCRGERSPARALDRLDVRWVFEDELRPADPQLAGFVSVDTPDAWRSFKALHGEGSTT